jgi:site-specific DNA-methyltransferase (adenine-specific)
MNTPVNTILKGDCVKAMRQLPTASVNFILTDPPYIVRLQDRTERMIRNDVMPWAYSGNHHHPSEKSVKTLLPLVEAFSKPGGLVLAKSTLFPPLTRGNMRYISCSR